MTEQRLRCARNVTKLGHTKEMLHEQVEVMSLLRRHHIARNGRNNVATHHAKCYRCLIYNRYNCNNCMRKIYFVVAQVFFVIPQTVKTIV